MHCASAAAQLVQGSYSSQSRHLERMQWAHPMHLSVWREIMGLHSRLWFVQRWQGGVFVAIVALW
jgi:hypothetical protein